MKIGPGFRRGLRDAGRQTLWYGLVGLPAPEVPRLDDTLFTGPVDASKVKVAVLTTPDEAVARAAATLLAERGVGCAVARTPRASRVFTDADGRVWTDVKPWVVLVRAPDAAAARDAVRRPGGA